MQQLDTLLTPFWVVPPPPSPPPPPSRFEQDLELPSLPEMVFPGSSLRLEHMESGMVLEFLALDALRPVNAKEDLLKVAAAEEWSRQRCVCLCVCVHHTRAYVCVCVFSVEGLKKVKEVVQAFDWTYTTDYKGTLSHLKEEAIEVHVIVM